MTHLIPVKRLDKNGRLVTKHVKPQNAASSSTNIPAPVASPMPSFDGAVTIPSGVSCVDDIWKANHASRGAMSMESFNQDALREVNELIIQAKGQERSMGVNLAVGHALDLMADFDLPSGMHNLAVFGPVVMRHGNIDATRYVTGLHELFAPREIDFYVDATEEEKQGAKALVEFTVFAEMEIGSSIVRSSFEDESEVLEYSELRDPELTDFLLHNPDALRDVMDIFLKEQGPIPVDILKERLKHSEKALRDGVL